MLRVLTPGDMLNKVTLPGGRKGVTMADKTVTNYPPPALPVPARWEPRPTARKLAHSVRIAVEALYNAADDAFRRLVAATKGERATHPRASPNDAALQWPQSDRSCDR